MSNTDFNFDDGMTEAEKHFFATGGDVNDELAKSIGGPLGKEPPASPPAQDVHEHQHEAPVDPGRASPQEEDPGDELVPGQPNPRRVSYRKYQAEQEARAALEKQLQERAVAQARIEERLNLLQQAMQPEPAAAPQEPEDERPDPTQDIFAYTAWQERQLNKVMQEISDYKQQITAGQAAMDEERRYFDSLNDFAGTEQNFLPAYHHLLNHRKAELLAPRYPQASVEDLMRMRPPPDIQQRLLEEERSLYQEAFATNQNPGAVIFRNAQLRGWRAPQAAPAAAAAPAQQAPGTALGAAPAAALRPGNGAAAPVPQPVQQAPAAPQQAPTATDLVEAIRRGQPAAQSLSKGSGSAVGALTPEMLANMSDEDFAAIFNELQHGGNKARLQELMGR